MKRDDYEEKLIELIGLSLDREKTVLSLLEEVHRTLRQLGFSAEEIPSFDPGGGETL